MRRRLALGILILAAVVAASSVLRVELAFGDPNFDASQPRGMLKSDPALLYYFTERILENGGLPPDDFRSDPRVQHPGVTDIAAEFTVGQEFLVAWCHAAFGGGSPLHAFCVRLMALCASLAAVGVWLVVLARTKSVPWATLAVLLFALLPANYRTIGFILVREDVSFPLFALHLGLLAIAERRRTWPWFLSAGCALAAALATWHAMSFFVLVELGVLALGYVCCGKNAFAIPGAWAVLVGPVLAGLLVPALRSSWFLLGLPMVLATAMLATALTRRTVGVAVLGIGLAAKVFGLGGSSYAHVYEVLVAKLRYLGVKPVDPNTISFDARLLWQGPFETLAPGDLLAYLGWGALALVLASIVAWRQRATFFSFEGFLLVLALVALPVAWLIGRTFILAGLCLPAAGAVWLAREEKQGLALGAFAGLLLCQVFLFGSFARGLQLGWYVPHGRQDEIAALVTWVDANVPESQPIVGDFMNSTAILAHAGNPIVLQPKYETERSRRRAQLFFETFFAGTPVEFGRVVREDFQSELVLLDRYTLEYLSSYTAGHTGPLRPGTAAEVFLSQDEERLRSVPGFELIYRSPPSIQQVNGEPYDFFRLYRVSTMP